MPLISFSGCDACSLKKDWPRLGSPKMPMTVPEEGSDYRIVALGEAPGKNEDNEGRQFVGTTGKYLRDRIPTEWKRKLYWQNIIRCRPQENRDPTPREISCCSEYLEQDLLTVKPNAIIGFGDIPLHYFISGLNISKLRGIPIPVKLKDGTPTWFFPTFHPSYPARSDRTIDKDTVNAIEPVFRNDIKKFFSLLPTKFSTPPEIAVAPTNIIYPQSREEAIALFNRLREPYAHDIETFKLKPYMRDARIITAAYSDGELTFAFPVNWPGNPNPWGKEAHDWMMKQPREWIAQNSAFELIWTWFTTKQLTRNFHDTEILARLAHRRTGVGELGIATRIHLGLDVKALTGNLDKDNLIKYPIELVLKYNALDAWSTAWLFFELMSKMDETDLANYKRILSTVRSTVAMEMRGMNVDIKESERLQNLLRGQSNEIERQARALPEVIEFQKREKKILKLSEPQSVGYVLDKYCNLTLPKSEANNYVTDDEILSPYVDQYPLAAKTLDYREVEKQRSTYVEPILTGTILGADNLLHSSYTAVHTKTYRLSSRNPNMQNFPKRKHKEIRKQIVAPPGFILVSADYGQLEARTLVMASGDVKLRNSFIVKDPVTGKTEDIHSKWLLEVIKRFPPYMDRLIAKTGQSKEKEILKAGRDIIKTDFVFASFYGSIAKSVAERALLPLPIAEELLFDFWQEYAGVKRWIKGRFEEYQLTGLSWSLTGRVRDDILPGNEPINTPIQGTAAEIVLEAQNALFERSLVEDLNLMPRINVHDDLTFILPDDSSLEQYIKEITREITLPRFDFINVPLMTEVKVGYNWAEMEDVGKFSGAYIQ